MKVPKSVSSGVTVRRFVAGLKFMKVGRPAKPNLITVIDSMQDKFKVFSTVYVCVEATKIVSGREATVTVLVWLQS